MQYKYLSVLMQKQRICRKLQVITGANPAQGQVLAGEEWLSLNRMNRQWPATAFHCNVLVRATIFCWIAMHITVLKYRSTKSPTRDRWQYMRVLIVVPAK